MTRRSTRPQPSSGPNAHAARRPRQPATPREDPLPTALPHALEPTAEFIALCEEAGIEFDEGDVDRLGAYLALLLVANKAMNLTAIREAAAGWTKHVFDSLTLLPMLADLPEGARVIDVGSGGGLPGLPLAITMPHLAFTLLEATGKKAAFLRRAAELLKLPNVEVLHARAEVAGQDRGEKTADGREGGHRERYDAVVARAVGALPVLVELTVPFARVGGRVLLIKGQKAEEELTASDAALKAVKAVHVETIGTPTGRVVVLEKGSATPRDYPRADGEPARRPLGGAPSKRT